MHNIHSREFSNARSGKEKLTMSFICWRAWWVKFEQVVGEVACSGMQLEPSIVED